MTDLDLLYQVVGRDGQDIAWWQMSVRALVVFFYGLALVRIAGKRVFGRWGAIDILLSIIIGSNLSRALTGSAPLVETLVATTVLVLVHDLLTRLALLVPALGPLFKGQPGKIGQDGRFDPKALRRHGIGGHDVEEALREAGLKNESAVDEAWIERNGDISILKRS